MNLRFRMIATLEEALLKVRFDHVCQKDNSHDETQMNLVEVSARLFRHAG